MKNITRSTKVLLIILSVLILVLIVVIYWNSKQDKVKNTVLAWKTYQNKDMGFSFEYPGNWNLDVTEEANGTSFNATISPINAGVDRYIIISHTFLNYDNKSIDAQFQKISNGCKPNDGCTVLTNKKAVHSRDSYNLSGSKEDTYYFATGKYIIQFYYTYNNNKNQWEADKTIFDKVANSFQIF